MYKSWKPEIKTEGKWTPNGMAFKTHLEANIEAQSIYNRYGGFEDFRAVESDQKPNYRLVDFTITPIKYKMEEVKIVRAYLTLMWASQSDAPFDGFYKSLYVDYPLDKFETSMVNEYQFFDFDAFYACDDPDDYNDEENVVLDYQAHFTRLGNLPAGLPIVEEAGLPWRIIYNSSSFETIEVEGDEEVEDNA